jgi:hypothetical protein
MLESIPTVWPASGFPPQPSSRRAQVTLRSLQQPSPGWLRRQWQGFLHTLYISLTTRPAAWALVQETVGLPDAWLGKLAAVKLLIQETDNED